MKNIFSSSVAFESCARFAKNFLRSSTSRSVCEGLSFIAFNLILRRFSASCKFPTFSKIGISENVVSAAFAKRLKRQKSFFRQQIFDYMRRLVEFRHFKAFDVARIHRRRSFWPHRNSRQNRQVVILCDCLDIASSENIDFL